MAEYLTNTTDLTKVADAIRAKSGQTGQLVYPDGFASAVAGIKKAPATPYMEAEYIAVEEGGGITSHYIKRAKLYNHTAIYMKEFSGQEQLQNLDFSDASNNITAIESNAFEYALVDGLVLPNTISVLGPSCFATAYITTLTIPPLVTVLPIQAFSYIQPVYNTEMGEELPINIILPQNLTKIGISCFEGAPIKQITIPDTVTEIEYGAFSYCKQLASITLPLGLQKISDRVFAQCTSLTSITIPAAVTMLGSEAFQGCESLAYMDIQANATVIPDSFAEGCQLTELTIPASVASIGNYAFAGINVNQMTLTVLPTTPPTLGSIAFTLATGSVIKVPAASVAAYKAATNWSSYADYIVGV